MKNGRYLKPWTMFTKEPNNIYVVFCVHRMVGRGRKHCNWSTMGFIYLFICDFRLWCINLEWKHVGYIHIHLVADCACILAIAGCLDSGLGKRNGINFIFRLFFAEHYFRPESLNTYRKLCQLDYEYISHLYNVGDWMTRRINHKELFMTSGLISHIHALNLYL